jgi:hypothetical protein
MDFKGILSKADGKGVYYASDTRYIKIKYMKNQIEYEDLFNKALEYVCMVNNTNYGTPN